MEPSRAGLGLTAGHLQEAGFRTRRGKWAAAAAGLPRGLSCSHWQPVLDVAPLPRAMTRAPRGLRPVSLMDGGSWSSASWGPAPGP